MIQSFDEFPVNLGIFRQWACLAPVPRWWRMIKAGACALQAARGFGRHDARSSDRQLPLPSPTLRRPGAAHSDTLNERASSQDR